MTDEREMFTVWSCDHLWARYDAKDMEVLSQIRVICHGQATDEFHDTGTIIPVCNDCGSRGEHVMVSRRDVPHPFDHEAWAEVEAYEDAQFRAEIKNP